MSKVKPETYKIISRQWENLGGDCYGYLAICSCGEHLTEFTQGACEEKAQNHITKHNG